MTRKILNNKHCNNTRSTRIPSIQKKMRNSLYGSLFFYVFNDDENFLNNNNNKKKLMMERLKSIFFNTNKTNVVSKFMKNNYTKQKHVHVFFFIGVDQNYTSHPNKIIFKILPSFSFIHDEDACSTIIFIFKIHTFFFKCFDSNNFQPTC